jgi:DNA modification methylase
MSMRTSASDPNSSSPGGFAPILAKCIEHWPIDRLIPYSRNARTHSDAQVAQIAASVREFGFTNPVLVDSQAGIIAGHGRVLAARKLGMENVPVIRLDHLTDTQKRAYVIADNRLALDAGWDEEMLRIELAELSTADFDLDLLGFEADELNAYLTDEQSGLTDEDAIPEVPAEAVTRPGDLWILGNHRLLCGDSTTASDVTRLLNGAQPHLMVTDPPYGVEYDPTWRGKTKRNGKVLNDDRADWREAWSLFPGDVAYVWHGALHGGTVEDSLASCGFTVRAQIIWAKRQLVMGRGHYHWQHEPCWYAVRNHGHWAGDRKQSTLWQIENKNQDAETVHGTQKPVECMRRPIVNNSSPGQAIYEPFCGSGTTLIAAQQTSRNCLAMELSPNYCDVIVKRWQDFTGKQAVLDGSGQSFSEVHEQRSTTDGDCQ